MDILFFHRTLLSAEAREGIPPVISRWFHLCLDLFSVNTAFDLAHALLGDQQNRSSNNQQTADDIEQSGAHAAGGGQQCASIVDDVNSAVQDTIVIDIVHSFGVSLDFKRLTLSQNVIAFGASVSYK